MFLLTAFKKETKVTKNILEDSKIPLADEKAPFDINEITIIVKCKTGNFYFGKYNNQKVIIKKVDITNDVLILNEFIFWNEQKMQLFYPNMIGVLIKYNYAYLIFKNEVEMNLKNKLKFEKKLNLSFENKIKIARQLLNLLNDFKKNNIQHKGLRSDIIGLDSDNNIKLLDYGEFVELNSENDQEIKNEINKYAPPEYINGGDINESYDIYSFGCLLIELFSNKENNSNENKNDTNKINDNDNLSKILSQNINPLFLKIIKKCIEPDKEKRITIDELDNNLELILNHYYDNNNENENKNILNENFLNENQNINECYQYGKELVAKMNNILEDVNNNLENKIKNLKNDITTQYEKTFIEYDIMGKKIKEILFKFIESSKQIIDIYYKKVLDSTINMQMDKFNSSLNDLYDIIHLGKGMLKDILVFSNFKNQKNYKDIEEYLEKTKNELKDMIKKNSKESEFDLIYKIYENKYNNYQKYCDINNDCIQTLKQIQNDIEKYVENNNNIMEKALAIDLDVETIDINSEYFKSMNENIYAKIRENSNQIYIYNYFTKFISCHQIQDDIIFNSECYSFFDKEDRCIYVSGGQMYDGNINYDNSLYKISINFIPKEKEDNNEIRNDFSIYNFGEYHFEVKKLNNLLNRRCSHCMIRSIKDRNMIINIGGKNTKSTEVYNIECDKSANIKDLPALCPNPTSIEFNGCIYLFANSEFNLNSVYLLNMNKNENFFWENIQFNMNAGGLRRGMNVIDIDNTFYLFGGYDLNKEYADIYKVNINETFVNINFCGNLSLSHESSFNSNAIVMNKKINKEEYHKMIILMNTMNIVNEIDLDKGKTNYYELNQ